MCRSPRTMDSRNEEEGCYPVLFPDDFGRRLEQFI